MNTLSTEIQKTINKLEGGARYAYANELRRLGEAAKKADIPETGRLENLDRKVRNLLQWQTERRKRQPKPKYNSDLPIFNRKAEIIKAIKSNQVLVLAGETGSGKTTQLPQYCLEAGRGIFGRVACTQPRRIAAISVSSRIAEELNEPFNKSVGYKIRFNDQSSPDNFIQVMTDGMLLSEMQKDPHLRDYDTIIVDEAHERSLNIDFLLGVLRRLLKKRKDLKVIITSATIDTEKFSKAFNNAPVIQVSGRTFPVELRYMEEVDEEYDTYAEKALHALDEILTSSTDGDVLIFMPTERDIRETCDLIDKKIDYVLTLPLFARLSASDQKRVFAKAGQRKIIVSTNVAETSLTIPGIKYVIDTGVARIAGYNAATRTTSLPISPVSRSSADQRSGRCGRVENGICIRLYSEDDYEARPRFTPPEVLRTNLAEVILRMLSLNLQDALHFPFIDKPDEKAVREGYAMLHELGAVELLPKQKGKQSKNTGPRYKITKNGNVMARLPLDPSLSRMIIEGHRRGCLEEMMIIASALSIQDPRERPFDHMAAADRAQAQFLDEHSDFLSLLKLWNHFEQMRSDGVSTSGIRKFCKEHYISFRRLLEWRDIYRQLKQTLKDEHLKLGPGLEKPGAHGSSKAKKNAKGAKGQPKEQDPLKDPVYTAVHKSILSGFISHIAEKKEGNLYTARKGKESMIFPGSGLFGQGKQWIVAAELVRTSRLFSRTIANIDSSWLEELGGPLCKYTYKDPHWNQKGGNVSCLEQVSLFGFIIHPGRKADYGKANPVKAREIFIRDGLVKREMEEWYLKRYLPVILENFQMFERLELMESKIRRQDILVDEPALCALYDSRLPKEICDSRTLRQWAQKKKNAEQLRITEEEAAVYLPDLQEFPDQIEVDGKSFPVEYVFEPGKEQDGLTVTLPFQAVKEVSFSPFGWLVPGLLEEKIAQLLKNLPKEYRKQLVPINQSVQQILSRINPDRTTHLLQTLSEIIRRELDVVIPINAWDETVLPEHLRPRYKVIDESGTELYQGREPEKLKTVKAVNVDLWAAVMEKEEVKGIEEWDFLEISEELVRKGGSGENFIGYPGLSSESGTLNLRIFRNSDDALKAHIRGVAKLYQRLFKEQNNVLAESLTFPPELKRLIQLFFKGSKNLLKQLQERLFIEMFGKNIRTMNDFKKLAIGMAERIWPEGEELHSRTVQVLKEFQTARQELSAAEGHLADNKTGLELLSEITVELKDLIPEDFLLQYDNEVIRNLPRYLKGIVRRCQKIAESPARYIPLDDEAGYYIDAYHEELDKLPELASDEKRGHLRDLRWMIEEYKISVFAQDLGTAQKISPKRLDKKLERIRELH